MNELLNKIEKRAYQAKALAWLIHITEPDTDFTAYQVSDAAQLLFDLLEEQNEDISQYITIQNKKAASPHADQSKGLTTQDTTETGCREYCTTAAAGKQEEE